MHVTGADCDVTTDDGATLYVYVTIYAAIHSKGKSEQAPPPIESCVVDCGFVTVIMQQKKDSPISKFTTSVNAEDDTTEFLPRTNHNFAHLRCSTQSTRCCLLTAVSHFTLMHGRV